MGGYANGKTSIRRNEHRFDVVFVSRFKEPLDGSVDRHQVLDFGKGTDGESLGKLVASLLWKVLHLIIARNLLAEKPVLDLVSTERLFAICGKPFLQFIHCQGFDIFKIIRHRDAKIAIFARNVSKKRV